MVDDMGVHGHLVKATGLDNCYLPLVATYIEDED